MKKTYIAATIEYMEAVPAQLLAFSTPVDQSNSEEIEDSEEILIKGNPFEYRFFGEE